MAELYSITTGTEPRRTHRAIETSNRDILGETGDFLELVRAFVGYANAVLPEGVIRAAHKVIARMSITSEPAGRMTVYI